MYEHLTCRIEGVPPGMLQNNPRAANKLDPLYKQMQLITTKQKKTDSDMAELSRLEWYSHIYTNEKGRVIVPDEWIERMFIIAARRRKKGKEFEVGLMCPEAPVLEYDGPYDIDALWASESFIDMRFVIVSRNRVMRTRPWFKAWALTFTIAYLADVLNKDTIVETLTVASQFVGLSDYRPKFGRFVVKSIDEA